MANRNVDVALRANPSQYIAAMKAAGAATRDLYNDIDKTNDRTAWLAQSVLALAPAATTLGAAAVPVFTGMVTQMTVGAAAAGTMALGFNGIGDALKALNEYQLDPSAEKLEKLNETMTKIGDEGAEFVRFLDSLGPKFAALADTSREGMFPGVTRGLKEFMDLMPEVNRIVDQTAKGIGQLGRDAGRGLSGEGMADFFTYLENEARPILVQMGRTIGNFAEGMANMIVAFGPLTADFSKGMLEMSRSFVDWSDSLSGSSGFNEFVAYVREAGPLALDFLSSLVSVMVELVEAAAPIGGPVLQGLTMLLDVIGAIADTPLGTAALGFLALTSAIGRLRAIAEITGSGALGKVTAGMRLNLATAKMLTPSIGELGTAFYRMGQSVEHQSKQTRLAMTQTKAFGKAIAPVAGQIALLGVASTGVADGFGLSNTVMGAMIGSVLPGYGTAIGAAIGLTMDFAAQNDTLTDSLKNAEQALDDAFSSKSGTANMDATAQAVETARQKYIELVEAVEKGGLTGLKFNVESLFGENDVEEAYATLMGLEEDLGVLREREAEASRERANDQALFNSIQAETAALEDNIQAMRDKRAEALVGMDAELDYQTALLDASKAAKEYTGVLAANGQLLPGLKREGIEAKQELINLAGAWNGLSDEAQNTPGRFKKAIENFVDTAVAMGMGEKAARRLARKILDIPTSHETEIRVDADEAFAKIRALRRSIESIDRNIVITVGAVRGDTSGTAFLTGGVPRKADGGDIPGPRGVYGDKVLIAAAPTEFMVSNRYGQADRNREALRAANAGATLAVVGYADGGTIGVSSRVAAAGRSYPASGGSYGAAGAPAIDYDRLTAAMLRARPMYGPVSISGDPAEFKRQMRQDEQAVGLGGRPT